VTRGKGDAGTRGKSDAEMRGERDTEIGRRGYVETLKPVNEEEYP